MTRRRIALGVAAVLLVAELALLVSGAKVLVWEDRVRPGGKPYFVEGYGNLAKDSPGSEGNLVCRYFTGRGVVTRVLWYSPNNFMGADQCSFIVGRDF